MRQRIGRALWAIATCAQRVALNYEIAGLRVQSPWIGREVARAIERRAASDTRKTIEHFEDVRADAYRAFETVAGARL